MGIKQSRAQYVSDRGETYYVDCMENSHLANTITHIQKKMDALNMVVQYTALTVEDKQAIAGHVECLYRDQVVLAKELARRETCKDEC